MIEIEIWKDIEEFEGLYQVSNKGRVRSLDESDVQGRHLGRPRRGTIMALVIKKTGYVNVRLSKNGKAYDRSVHRLVGIAFIPNPNNYPCINHKDGNRANNNVENLEWCTYQYNNTYNGARDRAGASSGTPVEQYTTDGVFVARYRSINFAAKTLHMSPGDLSQHLRGRQKTYAGHIWKYGTKEGRL